MKRNKTVIKTQKIIGNYFNLPQEVLYPHTALGDIGLDNLEVKETIKVLEKKFSVNLYHYPITLSTTINNVACFVEQAKKTKGFVWFNLESLFSIFILGLIVVFIAKMM